MFSGFRPGGRQNGERHQHGQQHEDHRHAAVDDGPVEATLHQQADRERSNDRADGESAMQKVHRPACVPLVHPQDRRVEADFHAALAEADERAQKRVGCGIGRRGEERKSGDDERQREQDGRLGPPVLHQIPGDECGHKVGHRASAKDNSRRQVIPVEIRQDLRQRRADDRHRCAEQGEQRKNRKKQAAEVRFDQRHFLLSRPSPPLALPVQPAKRPRVPIRYAIAAPGATNRLVARMGRSAAPH